MSDSQCHAQAAWDITHTTREVWDTFFENDLTRTQLLCCCNITAMMPKEWYKGRDPDQVMHAWTQGVRRDFLTQCSHTKVSPSQLKLLPTQCVL